MRALGFVVLALVACGPPRPRVDAGTPIDAGEQDAGIDAGRERGQDPDAGWSVALPLPADAGASTRVGVSVSMALDPFGQPMIAAYIIDPNSDGTTSDNRLVFTRWNGADKAWQAPVQVEVVGTIDVAHPNRQISLARHPTTGQIGIVYVNESGVVRYGHSEDEGVNFSLETVSAAVSDGSKLSNPQLAYAGDALHVAYAARPNCPAGMCGKIIHRTRSGTGAFTDTEVQGALAARDWPFSMALDSTGAPAVAFFSDDMLGAVTLSYYSGGSLQTIATSAAPVDVAAKTPSVSLTLAGDVPRVAYHLLVPTSPDAQLWFSKRASGAWSTPVALPRNGPVGMLDTTQWYQAIVSEGQEKVAIAANFQRALAVGQMCGGPKLGRSTDGATFSVCHPRTPGTMASTITQGGLWVNVASHRPDKLTIVLDYETNANPSIGGGVILYREP
ncbi:MAG: hypothetical protein JNK82_10330 [Myxococcaceae bacterium]|nr:hypothetical protein [Myxococcaceae bacterium]